jgi:tetratricopeptide (TPR) repeat protein
MKSSYKISVKKLCRDRLRDFVRSCFDAGKLATARVLCFPGREALEIFEVYDALGIPRENIVCLEKQREHFNELKRRNLGVTLRGETLEAFIDTAAGQSFDIVSLDFTGQLATYENQIYRLRNRGFLQDDAIVFTNFCGAREADASKGYYFLARQTAADGFSFADLLSLQERFRKARYSIKALDKILKEYSDRRPLWEGTLQDQRGVGIHETVRSALTLGQGGMVGLLFNERDGDGSLSEQVRDFFDPAAFEAPEELSPELVEILKKSRKAAGRKDDAIPGYLLLDLAAEVKAYVHKQAKLFARRSKYVRLDVEGLTNFLQLTMETFLASPSLVLATQSYKYVSDKGTPMYADMYHVRRMTDLEFLGEFLPKHAARLDDLFEPLRRLSVNDFLALMERIRKTGADLARLQKREAATPVRVILGKESELNPAGSPQQLDLQVKKSMALSLLSSAPHLTNEDIALSLQAKPMQVAAWKAHMTMGTYPAGTASRLEELADRAFNAGRYGEALQIYSRLLKRDPDSVRLLNNRSVILKCLKRDLEALRTIDRAIALKPCDVSLLCTKAVQLTELGRLADAADIYDQASKLDPLHMPVKVGLGNLLGKMGLYDAALAQYDAALRVDPNSFEAQCGWAIALSDQGKLDEAIGAFDALAARYIDNFTVLYNRSVTLAKLCRHDDAIRDLSQAARLDPTQFCAVYNLGCQLLERGQYPEAHSMFAKALQLEPSNESARNNLGVAAMHMKNYEAAIETFSRLLTVHPDSISALSNRAIAWEQCERLAEALADCARMIELAPTCSQYRIRRGRLLVQSNRPGEAMEDFEKALTLDPQNVHAHFGKAMALSGQGDLQGSLETFRVLVEVDPDNVPYLHALANTLLDLGRFKPAIRTFDTILKLQPLHSDALNDKAMGLARLGKTAAALRCFDRAITLNPSHRDAIYNKATLLAQSGDLEGAVRAFDTCVIARPNDTQALCNRAMCKLSLGDIEAAEEDFIDVVHLDPHDQVAPENLRLIGELKQALADELRGRKGKAKKLQSARMA